MKRIDFLQKLGLGALAGGAILTSCSSTKILTDIEDCELTSRDYMGPFYLEGTTEVVNLNTQKLSGTPMILKGTVYNGKGKETPAKQVKIDIWHSDNVGLYHPNGAGSVTDYKPNEINLRGFVITDDNGRFVIKSIYPGYYGSRARHIHYKITTSDKKELITQSYFLGDDRIPHDVQAKNAGECRIINFENSAGEMLGEITFNI